MSADWRRRTKLEETTKYRVTGNGEEEAEKTLEKMLLSVPFLISKI
jgi:hypothetical protein